MSGLGNTGLGSIFIQRLTRGQNERKLECITQGQEQEVREMHTVTGMAHWGDTGGTDKQDVTAHTENMPFIRHKIRQIL